jgi:F-type H+-transporting ATPase subunit gamma
MPKMREIKKRMVAVRNIQRITKTMQMIATAKFTAAQQRTLATKPYAECIRRLVGEVAAAAGDVEHPLIDGPAERVGREMVLVITSDRGLCGAFNANVLRLGLHEVRRIRDEGGEFHVETAGKKAVGFFKFQKIDLAERHLTGDAPKYEDVERIASRIIDEFTAGRYDAVRVVSMRFESSSRQKPEVLTLLPLKPVKVEGAAAAGPHANYEFSPSSAELLADLLPTSVRTALFQAFIEAAVSEHIMRMIAMKAATENAKELSKMLRRSYNRARQAQITTELTEIIGGAAALE